MWKSAHNKYTTNSKSVHKLLPLLVIQEFTVVINMKQIQKWWNVSSECLNSVKTVRSFWNNSFISVCWLLRDKLPSLKQVCYLHIVRKWTKITSTCSLSTYKWQKFKRERRKMRRQISLQNIFLCLLLLFSFGNLFLFSF